jgi:hypothetical protein
MVDVVCVEQPQASWEERSMKHYAGLDVSVKETSLCIVDEAGRICREMKVVSHPEDLLARPNAHLKNEYIGRSRIPVTDQLLDMCRIDTRDFGQCRR